MSILDVWEKKICNFSHRTVDKAQALSETTRLRSLIAGEDKNYHSLCTQIGELYVDRHKEDASFEPDFQELMTLCQQSLERKKGYEDQIMSIRKVRPCPSCGAEVPLDFAYCNFCGARLPEIEPVVPSGSVKCPGCGAVIPDSMKFCNHCGTRQPEPDKVVHQGEVVMPQEPAAEETPLQPAPDAPAEPAVPTVETSAEDPKTE